jgi:hypothetical protein
MPVAATLCVQLPNSASSPFSNPLQHPLENESRGDGFVLSFQVVTSSGSHPCSRQFHSFRPVFATFRLHRGYTEGTSVEKAF